MNRTITLNLLILGTVFISGCGLLSTNQPQTTIPNQATEQSSDEITNWKSYTNNRVAYKFKNPSDSSTSTLYEIVKYPSINSEYSKTEDFVQFAINDRSFGIKTYVGEGTKKIETWIQDQNSRAFYKDLNKYNKLSIGGNTAYRIKDLDFVYVLAGGNIYEIVAYQNQTKEPVRGNAEPLFDKWLNTIEFTK